MSRILGRLMASGDPAVKAWGHELVEAARKRGVILDPVTEETLHQAIEAPSLFEAPQDGPLLQKLLGRSYRAVIDDRSTSRRFRLTSQPAFQETFSRVLAEHAESAEGPVLDPGLPLPTLFRELEHKKREDVIRAATGQMARAEAVRQTVRDAWLREQALSLFNAADAVVRTRPGSDAAVQAPHELQRIEEYLSLAERMIQGSRFLLAHQSGEALRDVGMLREVIASSDRECLTTIAERLQAMLASREINSEFMELTLQARWRMLGIHAPFARFALEGNESPSDAATRISRGLHASGRVPDVEELALISGLLVMAGKPRMAVVALNEFQVHPLMRGSALLLSAWRDRLGREDPRYRDAIEPEILVSAVGVWRSPAAMRYVANPDRLAQPMVQVLSPLLQMAREQGRPVHLEFGAGTLPQGIRIAQQDPESLVLSIEGEVKPIQWKLLGTTEAPPNFHLLEGWSEWLAPHATEPFAESAVMVAPSPLSIRPMLLSALLAVKPGGRIDFFQPVHEEAPLSLLYGANIGFEQTLLDPRGAFIPQSLYLRDYQVRLTRVIVPRFVAGAPVGGFAPEAPSERPLQLAVSAGAGDAIRLSTRRVGDQTILVVVAASTATSALKR